MRMREAVAAGAAVLSLIGWSLAAAPPTSAGPRPAPGRVPLEGTRPAWTQLGEARSTPLRPTERSTASVTARVYLAGKDPAGLAATAHAVSDPRSALYHHYLTPTQVKQRFGAAPARRAAVRSWLTGSGLTVTAATDHYLAVRGPVAAAERAFGSGLRAYDRQGQRYLAPEADLSVPAELARDVLGVTDLGTAPRLVHPGDRLPPPQSAFVNAGPFSRYYGSTKAKGTPPAYGSVRPWALSGYTGKQLRKVYGVTGSGLTGAGATVAVVGAYDSPTIQADIARYAKLHGDAPYARGQLSRIDARSWSDTAPADNSHPNGCDARGWYGEQSLDLEAVHAVAPAAKLVYLGASTCNGSAMQDDLQQIVDKHLADVVNCSWGGVESDGSAAVDAAYDQTFQEGATEGIGFYFASGDDGDEQAATGTKQVSEEAGLPWVTAVGGTTLALDKQGQYAVESGWGNHRAVLSANRRSWGGLPGKFTGGAGGGTSHRVPQPDYQRPVVPAALSGANGGSNRVVPDIAADADPATGFRVGQTQTFPNGSTRYSEYRIGGTSLAAPLISGLAALVQQRQGFAAGFANPALYQRYSSPAFRDVTAPAQPLAVVRRDFVNGVNASQGLRTTLTTEGSDSSLATSPGYDAVTGVGSPSDTYLTSYPQG